MVKVRRASDSGRHERASDPGRHLLCLRARLLGRPTVVDAICREIADARGLQLRALDLDVTGPALTLRANPPPKTPPEPPTSLDSLCWPFEVDGYRGTRAPAPVTRFTTAVILLAGLTGTDGREDR